MTKLSDKNIWITGASSGIGEQLAYQLAEKGNRLILSSRRREELERVKKNCLESTQENIRIITMDLSDLDSLDEVANRALATFGGIDVLMNNGGISQRSLAIDTNFNVDQHLLNVNFLSVVKLTKLVLPGMLKRNQGHITVTSSLVGKFGTPYRSSYSASKHALHGFFDALDAELSETGIYTTLFCAGYIKTNISVNALTGDGSLHNKMDENQAKGKSAEEAARAMIRSIEFNKREVYFGGKEIMGIYLKRFFPSMLTRIVRKMKINQVEEP